MNKLLLILCLLAVPQLYAQEMNGPHGGGGPAAAGRIYGKLQDGNGHGIDYATVLVLKKYTDSAGKEKNTLLKGVNTESNGDFSVEDVPLNTPLKLSASEVGYEPLTMDLTLTRQAPQRDLGNLKMKGNQKELKEAVVTAQKAYMTTDMEKKVFDVTKDLVSSGGNGIDVLKNVPSVNVDIDGNVTMRGGSPQLLIDGKPTTLTMDEIPADAIESVEVISNPSAKYDASGGGTGILNIVLKKNRKSGYNGNVRAGADSYGGLNGGASLNIRQNKINFSADVNVKQQRDRTIQSIARTDGTGPTGTQLDQHERDTTKGAMVFSKIGLDYFVSNRTTLSMTAFAVQHKHDNTSNINMNTTLMDGANASQYSHEDINSNRSFNGRGATLGVKHLFAKEKESWTADGNYFSGNANNNSLYTTNNYIGSMGSLLDTTLRQKIAGGGHDHNIVLQSDFSDPLSSKTTLEAGVRAELKSRLNNNDNYNYDTATKAYDKVYNAASDYTSQSNVYAAYATIASSTGNFSYKAGLRAESSNYEGTLLNSGQTFSNQYPVSLFPSLFLGQKLGGRQELQLSYTRRVNRPNFFQLIPFTDSSNLLNITRGNPDLVPEFTQSVEFTYLKNLPGSGTFLASAYYKYTDHLITGYVQEDATTGRQISTYINAKSSYSAGSELTLQMPITKWWDVTANVNIYHSEIDLDNAAVSYQQIPVSWFGKLNTNLRLPAGFSIQLSGMYQSKSNVPVNTNSNQPGPPNMQSQSASQGYINPFYEVDIAAKKTFLANKLSASLSFNDIFRSRVQDQYTSSGDLTQYYDRLRNPQLLRLNLAYNFGKLDASIFQRKNNNTAQAEE